MKKECCCIVPFYNEKSNIIETIKQIENIKAFDKILLINDGSTDEGEQKAKEYIQKQSIKHIQII